MKWSVLMVAALARVLGVSLGRAEHALDRACSAG